MRSLLVVLLIFAAAAMAEAQEARETRVALVIGNGAYASVGSLENPARDAAAVARALREAGFSTVDVAGDLGRDALLKALRRFEAAADKADWALVYYAGHGLEVGGINYLIPVDARIGSDRDVEEEAVSLTQVQKRLEGAHKLRVVILDACRDNPFAARMRRTQASRTIGRGLGRPELPQTGSLVAYSAAAGQIALDGETNSGNSPYAAALVRNLALPDVEVNLFFRKVRAEVLRSTGNKQEPATYESLPEDRFVLHLAPAVSVPAPSAPLPSPQAAPPPTVGGAQPPDRPAKIKGDTDVSSIDAGQSFPPGGASSGTNGKNHIDKPQTEGGVRQEDPLNAKSSDKPPMKRSRKDHKRQVAQRVNQPSERHNMRPAKARGSCPTFEGRPVC